MLKELQEKIVSRSEVTVLDIEYSKQLELEIEALFSEIENDRLYDKPYF